ncbi:unnamed protein product [Eretmochelys imbricata]
MSLLCHRRMKEDVADALTILAVKSFYCQSLRRSSGALTLRTSVGRSWAITLRICYERHYESAPEASQVPDFSSLSSCEEDGDSSGGLGTRCALEALKGNAFKTCILMFIQKRLF